MLQQKSFFQSFIVNPTFIVTCHLSITPSLIEPLVSTNSNHLKFLIDLEALVKALRIASSLDFSEVPTISTFL